MNGQSQEIAGTICEKIGHNIAVFEQIGKTMCSKCGMTLDEIRMDIGKTPQPKAA